VHTAGHVVVESIGGALRVHVNSVGVATNDPPYDWHETNLNNYANLSPRWPTATDIEVETEVGTVPQAGGHGYNLLGIPGDYSPSARFVRLFFLKQVRAA
jgi:choloylglycine hydrolase